MSSSVGGDLAYFFPRFLSEHAKVSPVNYDSNISN